jgi:hypothetical protein
MTIDFLKILLAVPNKLYLSKINSRANRIFNLDFRARFVSTVQSTQMIKVGMILSEYLHLAADWPIIFYEEFKLFVLWEHG